MIDIHSQVFDRIYNAVIATYPTAFITGEYVKAPSSFPCVSMVEIDNHTKEDTYASDGGEAYAVIVYEVNIYSNKGEGKVTECRAVAALVDAVLMGMGFTRKSLEPVQNLLDATVYRMIGRYRATVSQNETIYRR